MSWKKSALLAGAVLVCAGLIMAPTMPPTNNSKSATGAQPRAGIPATLSPAHAPGGSVALQAKTNDVGNSQPPKPEGPAGPDTGASSTVGVEAQAKLDAVAKGYIAEGGPGQRACADCLSPNADLGTIGIDEWGYSVTADCGTGGKWYASFNGQAGMIYHFDLCPDTPGAGTATFDIDIAICDAACTILTGVDGSCSVSDVYRPNDFTWTCTTDGTYFVKLAPYRSYNQHNCTGTASNTFTMQFYAIDDTCAGNRPPNDECTAVVPAVLSPGVPATFTGDSTCALPDCASFPPQSAGGGNVWEAFTVTGSATGWDITLDYCGTTPKAGNAWLNLALGCPCTGFTAGASPWSWGCADTNVQMTWLALADGTYYYPVMMDPATSTVGPYTISVVAVPHVVTYCAASGGCDEFISRVVVGGIDNATACSSYADYTAMSTPMTIGTGYPITVYNGPPNYSTDECLVWVDWNADLDFDDAGETFTMAGSPGIGPYTGTITPPLGALIGQTRMRVRINYAAAPPPCGTTTYGEVEDYSVDVREPLPEGACCFGIDCQEPYSAADCAAAAGVYKGDGSHCTPNPCIGACCFTDGSCQETVDEAACTGLGGTFEGAGTDCTPNSCPQPAPPNDLCINAIAIGDVSNLPWDNTLATTDGIGSHTINKDLWYCYTATCTGDALFSTCGSSFDTKIAVWDTCVCPPTTELGYVDDNGPACSGLQASVSVPVIAGHTYLVQVGAYSTYFGTGVLTISCVAWPQGACCMATGCVLDYEPTCVAAGGVYGGDNTACSLLDCNGNSVDDFCDILSGTAPDCNGNGVPDSCDIASGFSQDVDVNGVPDDCDPDCNNNNVPDACELPGGCATGDCGTVYPTYCGTALDCQPDGIPDECQLTGGAGYSYAYDDGTHENSIGLTYGGTVAWMNHFTVVAGGEQISSISIAYGTVANGTPLTVYLWNDPDGNGNPGDAQVLASAAAVVADADMDVFHVIAIPETNVGPAGTSFFAGAIIAHPSGTYPAAYDDGSSAGQSWVAGDASGTVDPNNLAAEPVPPTTLDAVGYPGNWMVRADAAAGGGDCNGNLIPDDCDIASGASQDCNLNGTPDECELAEHDCNGNLRPDDCDIASGTSADCNGNGIPDECDIHSGFSLDCNLNGIPDSCDIASGTSLDCLPDGIPDECQVPPLCPECPDCNEDGIPDACQLSGRDPAIIVDEGFESGTVPPTGWTAIVNNTFTWEIDDYNPYAGLYNATCLYDETYSGTQDEWIISPSMQLIGNVALSGYSNGSVYWGITPYDNYDLEAWVLVSADPNSPSNTLLGKIDQLTWVTTWAWAPFSFNFTAPDSAFRIGFRYHGYDGAQAGLDAVLVEGQAGPPANDCNQNGIPDDCDLCGDFDGNGLVNAADFNLFIARLGKCSGDSLYLSLPCTDLDDDGCVTLVDYQLWIQCYRQANGKNWLQNVGRLKAMAP